MVVVLGLLLLADAASTLLWQEPVSALYASLRQHHLAGELRHIESEGISVAQREALLRTADEQRRVGMLAARLERRAPLGSAVGRIDIPTIEARYLLINGTGTGELEQGPGIYTKAEYPDVTFPGVPGVTAIAGHRTTFLAPFRRINELHAGERIFLTMPYARFVYTVIGKRVVSPTDVSAAVKPFGHKANLVLSACTPLFSAAKRLLVFARLSGVKPRGDALIKPRPKPAPLIEGASKWLPPMDRS